MQQITSFPKPRARRVENRGDNREPEESGGDTDTTDNPLMTEVNTAEGANSWE